jgi:hypothetical protein
VKFISAGFFVRMGSLGNLLRGSWVSLRVTVLKKKSKKQDRPWEASRPDKASVSPKRSARAQRA